MTRFATAAVLAAIAATACGTSSGVTIQASNSINGGVIPISQEATYAYSLSGCQGMFQLASDSGRVDYLQATSGKVYLTAGNWTAACGSEVPANPGGCPTYIDPNCVPLPAQPAHFVPDSQQAWSLSLSTS